MKNASKLIRSLFAVAVLASAGLATNSQAQISGDLLGLDQLDEASFHLEVKDLADGSKKVRLSSALLAGAPEAHAFLFETLVSNGLVGSDAADSLIFDTGEHDPYTSRFDGGDGSDFLKPNQFDGGDGSDFLVGSDAADSLISDSGEHDPYTSKFDGGDGSDFLKLTEFDGGDGPDYLVGSDAADSLIGDTGEHDPYTSKFDGGDGSDFLKLTEFDGGDGPDYLVGSDAADSLVGSDAADSFGSRLPFSIEFVMPPGLMPVAIDLSAEIHALFSEALAQLAVPVDGEAALFLIENLNATGNEVAIFEDYGVSLKSDGNEVAIVRSLDDRSLAQRWDDWSLVRSFSKETAATVPAGLWADEVEGLLLEFEVGLISENQLRGGLVSVVREICQLNGFEGASIFVGTPGQ